MSEVKTYRTEINGTPLTVQLGKLAQQANGSCVVQYGDTTVLITATMGNEKLVDYFPLSVDYEEKYYAAGKLKGSKWLKREGRPSEEAILAGRLIDRSLRPRFNHNLRNEVQIVATVLTFDAVNDPDIPALFGASLALMLSDIPFDGPVAGIRVGYVDGQFVLNPTYAQRATSTLDLVIAGTEHKINMIEAGAKIVPESIISEGAKLGHESLHILTEFQQKIAKECGKPKRELKTAQRDETLTELVHNFAYSRLDAPTGLYTANKQEFYANIHRVHDETLDHVRATHAEAPDLGHILARAESYFEEEINQIVHKNVLKEERRPDGRKLDQLREISAEVSVLPRSHGTGLFQRGQTQALSILTLASPGMEQWVETMEIELTKKRFMHHYVFPPFSVGEVGRLGNPGRREIGHGALAERALEPIIPSKDVFPYTIRVVSEILGSNGSSSMASVCGASLALMDGGVPIVTPAAGIAMGLMFDEAGEKYKILTDIQGPEDHHGDMDLKVAGTSTGVTAMQMDVKVEGITVQILTEALAQARKARLEILGHMGKAIQTSRTELSDHAPRVQSVKIPPTKIGALIGPQGKVINDIIEKTGAAIDIDDDGTVFITSPNPEGMAKAVTMVKAVTYEPKPGDEFDAVVSRLLDFGAMVEYAPGKEGLVHTSEMPGQVRRPADVVSIGQNVHVRIKNIDDLGRVNLTMRSADDPAPELPPRDSRPPRTGSRPYRR